MSPSTIWLIVMVVLVLGELATVGLTFIWFAVGALGGAITAWMGGAIWVQVIVFLALSGLALARCGHWPPGIWIPKMWPLTRIG